MSGSLTRNLAVPRLNPNMTFATFACSGILFFPLKIGIGLDKGLDVFDWGVRASRIEKCSQRVMIITGLLMLFPQIIQSTARNVNSESIWREYQYHIHPNI